MTYIESQNCKKCKLNKHVRAFVGSRSICRECWLYLTPEEKKRNLSNKFYKIIKGKDEILYSF